MQAFCAAALVGALLPVLAGAQLRILAPDTLAQQFAETHGIVYGTTATFGAPYYGERVLGQLLYGETQGTHCTADEYTLDPPKVLKAEASGEGQTGQELVNVVLVQRGGCTFVTKVQIAQDKGAHAVVVVDKKSSELTSEQVQKIVMADDGWGHKVRIPSLMVSRLDGQKLIDAARAGSVIVELAWDIPRGEVVVADFWMSSGSRESSEFLGRFKDCAEALKYHLQFVPHYHVFSLPEGVNHNHLCADKIDACDSCHPKPEKFCAPDPDGPGPITGGDVVNEDLRQLCLWNTTARRASQNGAQYSQEFWDYVVRFAEECPLEAEGTTSDKRFGNACSSRVMDEVNVNVARVELCIRQNYDQFLEEQIQQVAWSPQALRLNGWRYSGPLDPEAVLKAVCSGYATQPKECEELLSGYTGAVHWTSSGLTFTGLLTTIAILASVLVMIFFLYKRHVTRSVRKVLREEVMLEVQTQMADYVPFEDSGGDRRHPSRTLAF